MPGSLLRSRVLSERMEIGVLGDSLPQAPAEEASPPAGHDRHGGEPRWVHQTWRFETRYQDAVDRNGGGPLPHPRVGVRQVRSLNFFWPARNVWYNEPSRGEGGHCALHNHKKQQQAPLAPTGLIVPHNASGIFCRSLAVSATCKSQRLIGFDVFTGRRTAASEPCQ